MKNKKADDLLVGFLQAGRHATNKEDITSLENKFIEIAPHMDSRDKVAADKIIIDAKGRVDRSQQSILDEINKTENLAVEARRDQIAADVDVAVSELDDLQSVDKMQSTLDNMRTTKWINDSNWAKQTKALNKKRSDIAERQSGMLRVSVAMTGEGPPLDPTDKDNQKAVDDFWTRETAGALSKLPPEEAMKQLPSTISNFVKRSGMVPSAIKSLIRTTSAESNIDQFVLASQAVSALRREGKLSGLNKEDIAPHLVAADLMEAGIDPREAAKRSALLTDVNNEPLRVARKAELKKAKPDHKDTIEEAYGLDDWFYATSGSGGALERATSDYKRLYEDWYLRTGNEEIASDMATKDMSNKWGVSKLTGSNRLMAYSPEAAYGHMGDGNDSEWMEEQLKSDLKDKVSEDLQENMILSFVPGTENNPLYHVLVVDGDGVLNTVQDQGSKDGLLRWYPNWAGSKAYSRHKNKIAQDKKDAMRIMEDMIDIKTNPKYGPDGDYDPFRKNEDGGNN